MSFQLEPGALIFLEFILLYISDFIFEISQVVAAMREMVNKDTQNLLSNSFLLDDDLW